MRSLSCSVLTVFSLLLSVSCLDEPECVRINNNVVGVTFKILPDGTNYRPVWDEISMVGTDSLISGRATVNFFSIPVNYFSEETTVKLRLGSSVDSLVLQYRVQTQFISEECGERYVLSNLQVITHTFDSVRLVNSIPGKDNKSKNIEIFFNE